MAELHCNFLAEIRSCSTEHKKRPSLYASIKLARFVYHAKERLKCHALQCLLRHKDVIELPRPSLQAQARQDLDRSCSEVAQPDRTHEYVVASKPRQLRLEVPSLLEELDEQMADPTPQTAATTTSQQDITTWIAGSYVPSFQASAWLRTEGVRTPMRGALITQSQTLRLYGLKIKAATPFQCLLRIQAAIQRIRRRIDTPFPAWYRHSTLLNINWENRQPHEHPHSQQQPQQRLPATRTIGSGGSLQPYAPYLQQAASQGDGSAAATFTPNLRPPMGPMQNYPSPHSDVSKDETRSSAFSVLPSTDLSPNMMKHMDKHTRPYVCNLQGCEKVRGFTYSGGLSRHQREVHRQNGGPKASYMCPHTDCKRSTGSGFSRKENLQEHLRRVHRHTEDVEADTNPPPNTTTQVSGEPRRRRRRIADEDEDDAEPILLEPRKRRRVEKEDADNTEENLNPKEDLAAQVKRLRRELQEKDERLRKLEETVELLAKQSVQKV
ncbi:MAG: hypothetical protein Q9209_003691 [Squamulea sp. 1 TL-2023]